MLVHLIEIPFSLCQCRSQWLQFDGVVLLWVVLFPDDAALARWCAKRGRVVGGRRINAAVRAAVRAACQGVVQLLLLLLPS